MNLDKLMRTAIQARASDIHLLQLEETDSIQIRFRSLGQVQEMKQLQHGSTLINRIKIAADLNVAESRRIQEGQFSISLDRSQYFVRVSIIKSEEGEKLALRILSPINNLRVNQLGLTTEQTYTLQHCIHQPSGLILVCGATGSGKTTTLYSCLEALNDGKKTIFTIEDPVELPVEGIYQFEPNELLNIDTFALLKAFLRQDPDIIMVGEIRDAKTADLAISAALTGHLVLATLHTNSALNTIHRLHNWQVDFFSTASTLKLIIHQSMTFTHSGHRPHFTMIQPTWLEQLPPSYQALIERPELWKYLRGE